MARRALAYPAAAAAELDRPALPRAGSGLAWFDGALAVVQDDAEFLLRVDPARGVESALPLPPGPGGRRDFDARHGGKRIKRDLECCVATPDGRLLGFGSGSTARRERLLLVEPGGAARYLAADALYRALRRNRGFSGSRLNLEGAASDGTTLTLFNRGNEPRRDGRAPSDASCALDWRALLRWLAQPDRKPPALQAVTQYGLGALDGCRLTFTDACHGLDGALWFSASAEASADAIEDGAIVGSTVGRIDAGAVRQARVTDATGAPLALKLEGLCSDPRDPRRMFAVLDADDPNKACELLELELSGPWAERRATP